MGWTMGTLGADRHQILLESLDMAALQWSQALFPGSVGQCRPQQTA